jgi:hypothetical protein
MERIQINGEWYVKESEIKDFLIKSEEELDLIPTHTESLILETSEFCFEATRCYRDNDEGFYNGIDIEFTDKRPARREDWIIENWDNMSWIKGVFENDPESIKIAKKTLNEEGLKALKHLLKDAVKREWLTIE